MGWKIAIDCPRFHEATALPMMISERQPFESRWSPCVEKSVKRLDRHIQPQACTQDQLHRKYELEALEITSKRVVQEFLFC